MYYGEKVCEDILILVVSCSTKYFFYLFRYRLLFLILFERLQGFS